MACHGGKCYFKISSDHKRKWRQRLFGSYFSVMGGGETPPNHYDFFSVRWSKVYICCEKSSFQHDFQMSERTKAEMPELHIISMKFINLELEKLVWTMFTQRRDVPSNESSCLLSMPWLLKYYYISYFNRTIQIKPYHDFFFFLLLSKVSTPA